MNILLFIIGITVLISFKGFQDTVFFEKYQFYIGKIQVGERVRLLSSGFLHADIMHLAFNMITLYFFAPIVIEVLGNYHFIFIYFTSIICGNMLSFYLYKNDYFYKAIGASGGVMGIIYTAILLYPEMVLGIYFIIPVPGYIFGIGYLLYSIYGIKAKKDTIGHTAHFGGAITGFLITLVLQPKIITTHFYMVALLTFPILVFFYLYKKGSIT